MAGGRKEAKEGRGNVMLRDHVLEFCDLGMYFVSVEFLELGNVYDGSKYKCLLIRRIYRLCILLHVMFAFCIIMATLRLLVMGLPL